MIPKALQGLLSSQFPPDATCWSQATDEVREMARAARMMHGNDSAEALDFRTLRTPAAWNHDGVRYIINCYELMTEDQRDQWIEAHRGWIEQWLQAARKRRGPPVVTRTLYQRVCDGSRLSNKEVREGYEFYKELSDQLYKAGPAFAITAKEAARIADTLHGFAVARKLLD